MSTVSASEARKNLFPLIGSVNENHDPVRITSKAGNAVLISEADYEEWLTTRHLFSSPANARWLMGSIQEWQAGSLVTQPHVLDEEDA